MMRLHAHERRRPAMKEEQIREQPDQLVQRIRHQSGDQSNRARQKRNQHNPNCAGCAGK
jgi:hypothetical protein